MPTKVFINLPVRDLPRSNEFFTTLGFAFDPRFTDATATCMIVSDSIFVMLLTHAKFAGFSPNPICDATQATEVLVCLTAESRQDIDAMVGRAAATGGTIHAPPQDHGFMYGHGFQDLDGHAWELLHLSADAATARPDAP